MSTLEIDQPWESAFPGIERPELYTSNTLDQDGFLPLNEPQNFFHNLDSLNPSQLYAASVNNALALKKAQDEYRLLDKWLAELNGKEPKKDPQQLLPADEAEQRQQATLYGYKYEAPKPRLLLNHSAEDVSEQEKRDVRFSPEPFQLGGFVPTATQYKAIMAKARNSLNPDEFPIVRKNGKSYIPKQGLPLPEYNLIYKKRDVDENGQIIRHYSSDEEDASPSKVVNKRLTRTRFNGTKHPPTRELSEAPSAMSTNSKTQGTPKRPLEEDTSPAPKRLKLNAEGKPRHHNQYTKARERAMQAASAEQQQHQQPVQNGLLYQPQRQQMQQPIFAPPNTVAMMHAQNATQQATTMPKAKIDLKKLTSLSTKDKRDRKWSDEELSELVSVDHGWLHDDPAKALSWRDGILKGKNPVRTYSMLRKWRQWSDEGTNKRPRKKKEASMPADSGEETPNPRPPARSRRALRDADFATTFSSAPASPLRKSFEAANMFENGGDLHDIKPNGGMTNDILHELDLKGTKNEVQPPNGHIADIEETQEAYEEIEVDQTVKEEPISNKPIRATRRSGKRSNTSTPSPENVKVAATGISSLRRSLRSSRRDSA